MNEGQGETQHCALLEAAVAAEREAALTERMTFNQWWNEGGVSPGNNPYTYETAAFWAWEGWHAGAKADACLVSEGWQAGVKAEKAKYQELQDVIDSIYTYANDTLSGRIDGPEDREWQHAAVVEIRNRARVFATSPSAIRARGNT